ncbi:hypothetical protein BGZ94_009575, partial [Podila epigama]
MSKVEPTLPSSSVSSSNSHSAHYSRRRHHYHHHQHHFPHHPIQETRTTLFSTPTSTLPHRHRHHHQHQHRPHKKHAYTISTALIFALTFIHCSPSHAATTYSPPPPAYVNHPRGTFHAAMPPPVDFSALGQMALLGDFDGLTPIITSNQQNTFEGNTFSILELAPIPGTHYNIHDNSNSSSTNHAAILSVPVLLASFAMDHSARTGSSTPFPPFGITSTCVLEQAPHQIYIGGYFHQTTSPPSSSPQQPQQPQQQQQPTSGPRSSRRGNINYVGMYDSKLKRFLAMAQGLDGPVLDLVCDSDSNQVIAVGQFRAPLVQLPSSSSSSNPSNIRSAAATSLPPPPATITTEEEYRAWGEYGGGVAKWIPTQQQPSSSTKSSASMTQADGMWAPLPFKGVNGIIHSVTKAQDGTFYFGGQFDTTTDGEAFSAPDTQLVNMDSVKVSTGNGKVSSHGRNILCPPSSSASSPSSPSSSTSTRGNWILEDNMPGYWRVKFPFHISPTLFRLWNVDEDSNRDGSPARGTKTFRIMAQPSNQFLNLSYIDPITDTVQYCTLCTLLPRIASNRSAEATSSLTTTTATALFQDFMVVQPELLHAAQIDIVSWYGLGGGLGGIEVYQAEIFSRAAGDMNPSSQCTGQTNDDKTNDAVRTASASSTSSSSSVAAVDGGAVQDSKDRAARSVPVGADWKPMTMPDGWQRVLAASISRTDAEARKEAYVDLIPYLQETGMYDVFVYTPGCSSGSDSDNNNNNNNTVPSNTCSHRGSVDVHMYFGASKDPVILTLDQTNTKDRADKIYSGMIMHSTNDFRPHVEIRPSASTHGKESGHGANNKAQTVVVDSMQFVKQATLNNSHSLLFYRPGGSPSPPPATELTTPSKDRIQGLDGSMWGNLPKQLPSGAIVKSLAAVHSGSSLSLVFIAGEFQADGYSNIVTLDGTKLLPLGSSSSSSSSNGSISSGLDGPVTSIALHEASSTLYVVGTFSQAMEGDKITLLPVGIAAYSLNTRTWTSIGNPSQTFQPGAQFQSVEISQSDAGQPQLVLTGSFAWLSSNTPSSPPSTSSSGNLAIFDIGTQSWVYQSASSQLQEKEQQGQQFDFGYVYGQVSFLNRIIGSSNGGAAAGSGGRPVVLIAGMIDSLDTYQVKQPENMAWMTSGGELRTLNLSPSITIPVQLSSSSSAVEAEQGAAAFQNNASQAGIFTTSTTTILPAANNIPVLSEANAGIMYFNTTNQEWVTIVGGGHADGTIGAGYFYSPPVPSPGQDTTLTYKEIHLASTGAKGEILSLGLSKTQVDGHTSTELGNDLLLVGGRFKSGSSTSGSSTIMTNGLLIYDLSLEQVVPEFTGLYGTSSGQQGEPVVRVIKNRPGQRVLVFAGDFLGVGKDTICEGVCVFDPVQARQALNKKKPIETAFKSLYGDNGGKKHRDVLKGIVNDIAFEDDKNMFVAGDLV